MSLKPKVAKAAGTAPKGAQKAATSPSNARLRRRMSQGASARAPWQLVLAALLFVVVLAVLLYSVYGSRQEGNFQLGQPSPQRYVSPMTVQVIDQIATERERQYARSQIDTIYTSSASQQRLVLGAITSSTLPANVQRFLIDAYSRPAGVSEAALSSLIRDAASLAEPGQRLRVRLLLERLLISSAQPNTRLTEAARDAAAGSVEPVMRTLQEGEAILQEGDILTLDDLRVLELTGFYQPRTESLRRALRLAGGCLATALLLSLPLVYLYGRVRDTLTLRQLAFLITLFTLALGVQRAALLIDETLLFIAFVPLLSAVIVAERSAILLSVWFAVLTAFFAPATAFVTFFVALSSSVAASLLAQVFKSRASLLFAGSLGGVVAALSFTAYSLLVGSFGSLSMLVSLAWITSGGAAAGILALATLPLAESNFGFLTEFRLLELMSPSSPLLQKLLLEAPGSYQHSLIISNLVDQAVTNIGGNALLARVGALYHDVGKLKRPQFFVENQFAGENPHDTLSPHLSYLIITSHVRDGLDLVREYGLPKALEPFVLEHHGTTVLSYFYKRALEDSDTLEELNFRYAGPRPQSKETAVLMIADAVESASRTLVEPSQGSIRAMIDRLIEQRLQDDQLADSPLNFNDLEVIANTFERLLTAILHRRVSYPSAEEIKGLKRGRDAKRSAPLPS